MDDAASRNPKPKSALPSHLFDRISQSQNGSSTLRTSVGMKEREKLAAAIDPSRIRKQALDVDAVQEPRVNGHHSILPDGPLQINKPMATSGDLEAPARDARDALVRPSSTFTSRPASPYTLNPPIDFDGLSWPSELWSRSAFKHQG